MPIQSGPNRTGDPRLESGDKTRRFFRRFFYSQGEVLPIPEEEVWLLKMDEGKGELAWEQAELRGR